MMYKMGISGVLKTVLYAYLDALDPPDGPPIPRMPREFVICKFVTVQVLSSLFRYLLE
uniref:Uncharacterized protein n=1 Tax=Nelumbo nucifera TaxID=4432 RepID=A0A822XVV6_NELNU|nr:TPA_asm: hypothetical protein HUJ06_025931 [Nelumbo nucifera]DAD24470.1 TPA_asm: hypothetical protein HUJ06_025934 [Nelumbo nucifera]